MARDARNPLGAYLRARREAVTAAQAGIADDGRRRVPGLRREEVAMLAGISAEYYLRLERGRDRNPSPQVLTALARVLQLDDAHFAHVMTLVDDGRRQPKRATTAPTAPPGALKLLGVLAQPAFIEDRYFEIVAANPLAQALSPGIRRGRNQLRDLFLEPQEQAHYPAWPSMTECLVANLRQTAGSDVADPRLIALTDELASGSELFRTLWARHDVRGQSGGTVTIAHPRVGTLTLNRERMDIAGGAGLAMVVFHADAGTDDARRLALLGPPAAAVD